ncbi:hypothetical protein BGZ65_005107 [Modicella reniformis]|uniref:Uncharacterized protein n=1 Tax=Modicella reniformis TaxID=1440133 RepID=A0A9P6ST55_9FUNG|nr:hypothetical protein BGZ65_005107 [Modicella reniformis]
MFGKSKNHYKRHFQALLEALPYRTLEEFKEGFVGESSIVRYRRSTEKAAKWLKWHLNPARVKYFFPATSSCWGTTLSKDTNAQESLGAVFQRSAPKPKLSIGEVLDHSYRFTTLNARIYYGQWRCQTSLDFERRGKLSSTTAALLGRRKTGRLKNSKNRGSKPEIQEPERPDDSVTDDREPEDEIDWNPLLRSSTT